MAKEKEKHARQQQAASAPTEKKPSLWSRIVNFPQRNREHQVSISGQLLAIFREAMSDVREHVNQVFFGQKDGPPAMGTPMAPTPGMVDKGLVDKGLVAMYGKNANIQPTASQAKVGEAPSQAKASEKEPSPKDKEWDAMLKEAASRATPESPDQGIER